jgi:hypothetical protein
MYRRFFTLLDLVLLMDFSLALKHLKNGYRVTKENWLNRDGLDHTAHWLHMLPDDNRIFEENMDEILIWEPRSRDLTANDWLLMDLND